MADAAWADFVARRDRLFAQCRPDVQAALLALAAWYGQHAGRRVAKPDALTQAQRRVAHFRATGGPAALAGSTRQPPSPEELAWAAAADDLDAQEAYNTQQLLAALVEHLDGMRQRGRADVLYGVLYFLLSAQISVDDQGWGSFTRARLDELAARSLADAGTEVVHRFDITSQCAAWPREPAFRDHRPEALDAQRWALLHEMLGSHAEVALCILDAQEVNPPDAVPLSRIALAAQPALARDLALRLRPHRPDQAARYLALALAGAGQVDREATSALLAEWLAGPPGLGNAAAREVMLCLHRAGGRVTDPEVPLPALALRLYGEMSQRGERGAEDLLVVASAGRSAGASLPTPGLDALAQRLRVHLADVEHPDLEAFWRLVGTFETGADEGSGAAGSPPQNPQERVSDRPLDRLLDRLLDDFMARGAVLPPSRRLHRRVSLLRLLGPAALLHKHHALFRAEFESLARQDPPGAGQALRRLALLRHEGRDPSRAAARRLAVDTFDALILVLDGLSRPDGDEARQGLQHPGWGSTSWMDDYT